jgi:hypothetical protein
LSTQYRQRALPMRSLKHVVLVDLVANAAATSNSEDKATKDGNGLAVVMILTLVLILPHVLSTPVNEAEELERRHALI